MESGLVTNGVLVERFNSLDPTLSYLLPGAIDKTGFLLVVPNESMVSTLHKMNSAIVIFRSMASEKMSNRSRKVQVEASWRLLCAGTPPQKWVQPQTELVMEYFYTVDEKSYYVRVIKVLHFGSGLDGITFGAGCRYKVVAEKLLLELFSIGWTFFPMLSTKKSQWRYSLTSDR